MDPYARMKEATKWMWGLGDYREVATHLEPHAQALAHRADVRPGMEVLDVAAGNGNFAIAAAERGARVTEAAALGIQWQEADAEELPFANDRFDVVASAIGLLLSAPLLLVSALAVALTSPGGVLFRQKRVGLGGEIFVIYKLRTGTVTFAFVSPEEGQAFWERTNPPLMALKSMLPADRYQQVRSEAASLMLKLNQTRDGRLVLDSPYLSVRARVSRRP